MNEIKIIYFLCNGFIDIKLYIVDGFGLMIY